MKLFKKTGIIIKKIGDILKKAIGTQFAFLKKNSKIVVDIVNAIKEVVESPIADIAVIYTKNTWDNELLLKAKKFVPAVAEKVAIAHGIIQASDKHSDAIKAITDYLKTLHKEGRKKFWVDLAAELNMAWTDGKLSYGEAIMLSQLVYEEFYKK